MSRKKYSTIYFSPITNILLDKIFQCGGILYNVATIFYHINQIMHKVLEFVFDTKWVTNVKFNVGASSTYI
jgi:hypothetical protein